jgi:glutamate racemase
MKSIGIVDSGLGGYTVYESLRKAYPQTSFVFLADQKHAPYVNKSADEIVAITYKNMRWFHNQGIYEVIFACNTTSSVALNEMRKAFPDMTLHGIIDLTVDHLDLQPGESVLVMATGATIRSGSYPKAIAEHDENIKVDGVAMVELVRLIEDLADDNTVLKYVNEELTDYPHTYSKIVLACTHYPIVKDLIARCVEGQLCDSREAIVDLLKDRELPMGESVCFTSGDPQHAQKQVKTLFDKTETFIQADTSGLDLWKS